MYKGTIKGMQEIWKERARENIKKQKRERDREREEVVVEIES